MIFILLLLTIFFERQKWGYKKEIDDTGYKATKGEGGCGQDNAMSCHPLHWPHQLPCKLLDK